MSRIKKQLLITLSVIMIFSMGTIAGATVNNYAVFQRGEKLTIESWLNGYDVEVDDVRRATAGYTYTYKDGSVSEASIFYNGEVYLPIRKMAQFTDTFYNIDGTNITFDTSQDYQGESSETNSDNSGLTNETVDEITSVEWRYGGYESAYPNREYEFKWIDGVKTSEFRYTGNNATIGFFRGQSFGSTKAVVKSLETVVLSAEIGNELQYNTTIGGVDSTVLYVFNSANQLTSCGSIVDDYYYDKNIYIDDYFSFLEALTEKYGEPDSQEVIWKDDLFKGDYNEYGLAVSVGDLVYYSEWYFDDFDLLLICSGEEYEVTTGFLFNSKIYEDDEKPSGL